VTGHEPLPDRRAAWHPPEQPFRARASGRPAHRPNIVVILADDLGWGDLACYGSLHNDTPILDHLARQGLRLTNAYAAAPTCSPTRIALYTGRHPGRLVAGLEEPLTTRDEHHGIPHDHPTLASLLRDAGYATAMFGKWHCGWLPWFSPVRAGFDTFFGNLDGALDYFGHIDTLGRPDLWEGEVAVEKVGYYTHLLSERAADHIRAAGRDRPFYLQLNYTAPHWPWEGPDDIATSARIIARAAAGPLDALYALFHFEGGSLATYREIVAALDAGIGTVLTALDERGGDGRDDTIVVFSSDNGGERYAFMWPFVGEKGDLEEGGIRVPLIVRWPAAIDGGQISDVPTTTVDCTATLLDAAGVSPARTHPLDGTTLLPWLLDADPPPERDLLWRTRTQGAIRRGPHKLLVHHHGKTLWNGRYPTGAPYHELFDLTADGREKANLAAEHPALMADLLAAWEAYESALLPYPTGLAEPAAGFAD
jgi:arylsulfatase A-like enzyme